MTNQIATIKTSVPMIAQAMQLTRQDQRVLNASNGRKISDLMANELIDMVMDCITKAYTSLNHGKKLTTADLVVIGSDVCEIIALKHPNLTIEEVSDAVRYGSIGEFKKEDDVLFISAANIVGWIKAYIEKKKRPLLGKIAGTIKEYETPKMTPEQLQEQIEKSSLTLFEIFKREKKALIGCVPVYNYLDKLGLIKFDVAKKKSFMVQADVELCREAITEEKRNAEKRGVLTSIDQGTIKNLIPKSNESVIARAKQLALNEYFEDLVNFEMELSEKIKEGKGNE